MARRKEMSKAKQELLKKQAMISVIRSVINDIEWSYNNAAEQLDNTMLNFKEFQEEYTGDEPIEDNYGYRDYLATIEERQTTLEAYEAVQNALLKLI